MVTYCEHVLGGMFKDPFVWVMGPQRLMTSAISAIEMFLLTYI